MVLTGQAIAAPILMDHKFGDPALIYLWYAGWLARGFDINFTYTKL